MPRPNSKESKGSITQATLVGKKTSTAAFISLLPHQVLHSGLDIKKHMVLRAYVTDDYYLPTAAANV